MSPRRNAVAGVALAAAGVVYRRLTGRKATPAPAPATPAPDRDTVDEAEVTRARSELAEELARRAARSEH
jgi:hypothetical protein